MAGRKPTSAAVGRSDFSPSAVAKSAPSEKSPRPVAKTPVPIVQAPLAQASDFLLRSVPWAHHVVLMEKLKDLPTRCWYFEADFEGSRREIASRVRTGKIDAGIAANPREFGYGG